MARTRRSQRTTPSMAEGDHTQVADNNDNSQIQAHTHKNTVVQHEFQVASRAIRNTGPSANPPGKKRTFPTEAAVMSANITGESASIDPPMGAPMKKMGPSTNPPRKKRTFPTEAAVMSANITGESASVDPPMGAPAKRVCQDNLVRSRPMQLDLESTGSVEDQQQMLEDLRTLAAMKPAMKTGARRPPPMRNAAKKTGTKAAPRTAGQAAAARKTATDKGKQPEILPSVPTHRHSGPSGFDPSEDIEDVSTDNDSGVESIADWLGGEGLDEVSQKQPAKVKEAAKLERATWKDSNVSTNGGAQSDNANMSWEHPSAVHNAVPDPGEGPSSWPEDTNLLRLRGSNQLTLSAQVQLIRFVIQDSIDLLRASLLFGDAFPKMSVASALIRDALLVSAESYKPASFHIHQRLTLDSKYMLEMTILPRARIALIRRDVKERCISVVMPAFLAMGSHAEIAQMAEAELTDYNYIYPMKPSSNGPLMGLRPYRNPRIIRVIKDLYFTGRSPFAEKFHDRFPVFEHEDGVMRREVPMAMVALVSTGMYAAIDEWSTGQRRTIEFSAQAYLEVYQENMAMLRRIRDQRNPYFHRMMSDIYVNVSDPIMHGSSRRGSGAELDLDNLED